MTRLPIAVVGRLSRADIGSVPERRDLPSAARPLGRPPGLVLPTGANHDSLGRQRAGAGLAAVAGPVPHLRGADLGPYPLVEAGTAGGCSWAIVIVPAPLGDGCAALVGAGLLDARPDRGRQGSAAA